MFYVDWKGIFAAAAVKCPSVFLHPHYKQYLCCWNGSTTSGGQALYSILSTLKKKSIRVHLSCISHSIVVLQWDLFSSGRFNTWAGQWKECNRVGWSEEGWGWKERVAERGEEGIVRRKARRNCKEERGNSYLKWVYTSCFLYLLDFIIRYFPDNSVE